MGVRSQRSRQNRQRVPLLLGNTGAVFNDRGRRLRSTTTPWVLTRLGSSRAQPNWPLLSCVQALPRSCSTWVRSASVADCRAAAISEAVALPRSTVVRPPVVLGVAELPSVRGRGGVTLSRASCKATSRGRCGVTTEFGHGGERTGHGSPAASANGLAGNRCRSRSVCRAGRRG